MKRNQTGFSIIESIMAVVIIILLGAVGWLFWDKIMNKPADSKTAASTSQSPTPSPSPTVSTKTYKSKNVNLAFDYPSSWSLKDIGSKSDMPGSEQLYIESPGGFKLYFNTYQNGGLGGAAGPNCVEDRKVNDFVSEGKTGYGSLGVISYNLNNIFNLEVSGMTKSTDIKQDCLGYSRINVLRDTTSNDVPMGYILMFTNVTSLSEYGSDLTFTTTKPNDKEYKEAVEILKSLRKV